jgi:transposase
MSMTVTPVHPTIAVGVGFDTARYGHHVTFLRADLQPACPAFEFAESRAGYDRVRRQFQDLTRPDAAVHFHIRLDAAGQYATNLETFLRSLPFAKTLTIGEPARNQDYRKALFPKRKADPVESLCAARFALVEKPPASADTASTYYPLREVVHRLQGQVRQSTRLNNQLHNLLARVFPELAFHAADLKARWVLQLLQQYPTPARLARAYRASLTAIPFLTEQTADQIQAQAATTVASFTGDTAHLLVRQLVTQLRHSLAEESHLGDVLAAAYRALPQPNHLDSIPGVGLTTAAVLTAKIVTIDRFAGPAQLVSYFGVFPQQDCSGLGKNGLPKPGRPTHMSRKGNDLVRKYLWNAARAGITHNPALRALFRRLRGRGVRGDVALGQCMRKLLHLVYAVWKTDRPFDRDHYPWEPAPPAADADEKTAGHKPDSCPQRSVVTAVPSTIPVHASPHQSPTAPVGPEATEASAGGIDFAALRKQVRMAQVLAHLGWLSKLKGSGPQRRGPCPLHGCAAASARSFSVHLGKDVFQCFHPPCAAHGNVLDLWAAVRGLSLYQAARDLTTTLQIELPTVPGTEKRYYERAAVSKKHNGAAGVKLQVATQRSFFQGART